MNSNKYFTHDEDMLDRFQQPEWDDVRIKAILATNQDQIYLENRNASSKLSKESGGYVRGAEYYGSGSND